MGDDPNEFGNSRRWIVREVENSLRRLGTDWIDLYQIHRPEEDTDIDETLGALTDLVRAGKIRYIGSSTFPAEPDRRGAVGRRAPRARALRLRAAAVLDPRPRESSRTCCPTCRRHGMGVIPWSPLAGGWLSGKWRKGADDLTSRALGDAPAALRPVAAREPAQARCGRGARAARGGDGITPDPSRDRVRHPPPGGDGRDHRARGRWSTSSRSSARPTSQLSDEVLDRIDAIVPPGTTINPADRGWQNPALDAAARRR